MGTADLLKRLHGIEESPWADWYGKPLNPRELADLLKPYEIRSAKVKIGDQSVRGYHLADLIEPWRCYGVTGETDDHGSSRLQ
jgi:uncharacterized protein DUF3631